MSGSECERERRLAAELGGIQDGQVLSTRNSLTAHSDGKLKIVDANTGELLHSRTAHRGEIYEVEAFETSGIVASIGADRRVVFSELSDLSQRSSLECAWGVRCVKFTVDGRLLISATDPDKKSGLREGTMDVWDVEKSKVEMRLSGHQNWVTGILIADSGQQVVSQSVDGTVRLWSLKSGECENVLDVSHLPNVRTMVLVDQELILGHDDGWLTRWSLVTGEQTGEALAGSDAVTGICHPANSEYLLASLASQKELRLIEAGSLRVIAKLNAGIGPIKGIANKGSAGDLQVVGESGTVRNWTMPTAK
jgi:WD40 repeat protein